MDRLAWGKQGAIQSNFGASTGVRSHKSGLPIFPGQRLHSWTAFGRSFSRLITSSATGAASACSRIF